MSQKELDSITDHCPACLNGFLTSGHCCVECSGSGKVEIGPRAIFRADPKSLLSLQELSRVGTQVEAHDTQDMTYLGDSVYGRIDGDGVVLSQSRGGFVHEVALDGWVLIEFFSFLEKQKNISITVVKKDTPPEEQKGFI